MAPRQTSAAVDDWQTIQPDDWQTESAAPAPKPAPLAPLNITPDTANDMFKAGVHAKMLNIAPSVAYDGKDEIQKQLGTGYDDGKIDPSIYNDLAVGLEGSVSGLYHRGKMPEELKNPGKMDEFIKGLGQMVGDVPAMIAGGVAGGVAGGAAGSEVPVFGNITGAGIGASMGAFAVPAAVREQLVEGIKNGGVKNIGDVLHRAASVLLAGAKGAAVGAASAATGEIPVVPLLAKSGVASMAVKGLYQATALTTTADLLDGKVPTASDFVSNAALIVPLNIITHGAGMTHGDAKQAAMDVYAKDGTGAKETAAKLAAQPVAKPDLPEGLRPAIETKDGVSEGETTEDHAALAERSLGKKPVTMEQLEAEPAKADDVLEQPKIHEQDVIDKAWELKKSQIEAEGISEEDKTSNMEAQQREQEQLAEEQKQAGLEPGDPTPPKEPQTIDDLYNRGEMKSGRGFVTPDGQFLSRMEAKRWMKENEPDVHDMWTTVSGDKSAELHSEQYAEARNRVQGRNLAEGESSFSAMSPDLTRFLAENRSGILNDIKAGTESAKYGPEAIRTLLTGPKAMLRAEGEQIVSRLRKEVPDKIDQEALHFLRDYRDDPEALRSSIEEIRNGDNEKLKAHIPAMERALEPMSPEMQKADAEMTAYFQKALDLGKQVGTLESGIDPSRYSPRMFMRATEDGEPNTGSAGRPRFSEKTVNSIRRDYLHTLDPLKSGDTEARTFNALDEMSIYSDRHANAIAVKLFKTELKNSALGIEGTRASVPADWVEIDPALRDKRTIVDRQTGESFTQSKNLYVPKEIAKALEPLFKPGDSQIAKFLHLQSLVKGIELTLSAFHIKAMGITAMNNMGVGDFVRAMHSDNSSPDFEALEQRGALYGLTTTKTGPPSDAYRGLQSEIPEEAKGFIGKGLSGLRNNAIVKAADYTAKAITEATFDIVQRKFKVMNFASKEAGWVASHPEATEAEYGAAMRGYSKEINAAYGGLNWEVMGVSKGMQNLSRLILLAPDWTFSNVANLKYAASDGGVAGAASRAFFVKSFVTGFAMTAAASIFVGGKYDASDVKNIDRVYLGTDKDGKKMYADWFFAGAPKDALTLAKRVYAVGPLVGLSQIMVGKAGPAAGLVTGLASNRNFDGKPISKPVGSVNKEGVEYTRANQLEDQGKYVAGRVVPITAGNIGETVKSALEDPNHKYSYKDILSIAADAIGSQTIHEGAPKGESGGSSRQSGTQRFESASRKSSSRFSIRSRR